jgi:hypothetical protein
MNVLCLGSRRNRLDLNAKDKHHQQFMLHYAWSEVYTDGDKYLDQADSWLPFFRSFARKHAAIISGVQTELFLNIKSGEVS